MNELLIKLDSTDFYVQRKEAQIASLKKKLSVNAEGRQLSILRDLAQEYADYQLDSAIIYMERLVRLSQQAGNDTVHFHSRMDLATILSNAGFFTESVQTLSPISREGLSGDMLIHYYSTNASYYHSLYNGYKEPDSFREEYREKYNQYRDSILMLADTLSLIYLRNIERKEARAGNFEKARRYNDLRMAQIGNPKSAQMATCLYDRFAISYIYEHTLSGEDIDNLLESAILEVELAKRDIASLYRIQTLLVREEKFKEAQRVSDHYFASLLKYGSRRRLINVIGQTVAINEQNINALRRSNNFLTAAIVLISLLLAIIFAALVLIINSRHRIQNLNKDLRRSDSIAKSYVGVFFKLYSTYIKRMEVFRTKIHSNLKKDKIDVALELTIPSGEFESEERKILFHNFDSAFVTIFPDFIEKVNSCLRPDAVIVPKKTEILSGELRVLALLKLGIKNSADIAEMMHCSLKTVYNLRSILKSRLAIPEEDFMRIMELN